MPLYGFNFQWMCSKGRPDQQPREADERALDFMAEFGFDFARIPTDYRFWTADFDYLHPDEKVLAFIDRYLAACRQRAIHVSLNMHRAPGYCVNRNDLERDNLWTDSVAQDAFIFLWVLFARRYKGVPAEALSFNLVNEPSDVGRYGMTRELHDDLMRRTFAAIRSIDPSRPVTVDGIGYGHVANPELVDLDVTHSGRGYQPFALTHYKAHWTGTQDVPEPVYPGVGPGGERWDKDALREFYRPWREMQTAGARVHIGEFGCFQHTPDDVALRWFADLLSLYKEFGWGYALWTFTGSFGIIEHGRPGAVYEDYKGYRLDRRLLDLLLENRAESRASILH
jgi:endoglucanase